MLPSEKQRATERFFSVTTTSAIVGLLGIALASKVVGLSGGPSMLVGVVLLIAVIVAAEWSNRYN